MPNTTKSFFCYYCINMSQGYELSEFRRRLLENIRIEATLRGTLKFPAGFKTEVAANCEN